MRKARGITQAALARRAGVCRDTGLPPARMGAVHTNTARAHLDPGDRDGAQTPLVKARDIKQAGLTG